MRGAGGIAVPPFSPCAGAAKQTEKVVAVGGAPRETIPCYSPEVKLSHGESFELK